MTAVSGIWNHAAAAAANPLMNTQAADSSSGSSGSSSNSSGSDAGATISANDFLTLLVTEMQNQDPTADTDPNEYINQLVNVNSLEQLININQTLSTAYPSTSTTSSSAVPSQSGMASLPAGSTPPTNGIHGTSGGTAQPVGHPVPVNGGPVSVNAGNLSVSSTSPSALRVARSLDGQRITR